VKIEFFFHLYILQYKSNNLDMNHIYPTIATVTNVYTDIITTITDVSDTSDVAVADSVCINIINDNTEPIILTNVVSDQNNGNENVYCDSGYKWSIVCVILFGIIVVILYITD